MAPIELAEAEKMARESFIRTVANLLSSSISKRSKPGSVEETLEVENPELLEEFMAEGRGVVLLLAHMGNWELLTRLQSFLPQIKSLGGFYRPLNNPILNERVLKNREADGSRLFSKRDSLHHVSGFLRENGVVGILADQRVGRQGELVEYFGRLTRASPLPSLLARRCRSEVVALSLRTLAPGKWVARFHRVEKPYKSGNCMKAIETAMRESMVDVFWLQERWKTYLSKRISPVQWIRDENARGAKPHRALIWAKAEEKGLPLPASCIHGDIAYQEVVGKNPCELEAIDAGEPLPVDYILVFSKNEELRKTAKQLGIPVFRVSQFSE
jgi:KDO2-lipid IV(A) lauroyltransferase